MEEQLLFDPDLLEINPLARITQVFYDSLLKFRNDQHLRIFYQLIKLIAVVAIQTFKTSKQCQLTTIFDLWMLILLCQSFLWIYIYSSSLKYVSNFVNILILAQYYQEIVFIPQQMQQDEIQYNNEYDIICPQQLDPSLSMAQKTFKERQDHLSNELRKISVGQNTILIYINILAHIVTQGMVIFSVILITLYASQVRETCVKLQYWFIALFLGIQIIQYFINYLFVLFFLITLPFICCNLIYNCIINNIQKKRRIAIYEAQLNTFDYEKEQIQGDPECHICMATYVPGDKVTKLPCNDLHHFHQKCIQSWLQVQPSCPFCRQELPVFDQQ